MPGSDVASRDKAVMRQRFHDADLPTPERRVIESTLDPARISAALPYPVVVKPTRLNGSRGVIRANDQAEFSAAYERVRSMLTDKEFRARRRRPILVEYFIPGVEVAVEGLMTTVA